MKLTLKELILFSILGALLVLSQIALSFLPNIELVSLFIIIFTLVYGKKSLYSTFIFIIIMGVYYGFGLWWFGYIIVWPLLTFLTLILKRKLEGSYLTLSIFSAIFGLCFGAFYALPYLIIGNISYAITYWIRGLPYDFIHMVGNYFIMLFLGKTIYNLLIKLNKNYLND